MSIIYARMSKVLFLFIHQNHSYKVQKEDIFCYQVKHWGKCSVSYLKKNL